jgi:hypothetical protein
VVVACDVLLTCSGPPLALNPGDEVLVLLPATDDVRGCILGIIAPYTPPPPSPQTPQQLELVSQREVDIRCGDSSITLHADGNILLKGLNIVTRAKRTHKIKAGSVQIN